MTSLPETLRASIEGLPIGLLLASDDGVIVLVNRALERLLAYPQQELIGQSIEVLVPETQRSAHTALRRAFQQHPDARVMAPRRDIFARRKDGSEVPVEISLTPVLIDRQRLVQASVIDVTERFRGEAQLRQALDERIAFEALVGDLAAQFVNLRADEVDRCIEDALGRLVRALGLDRSALFQVDESGDFVYTHQWTRPGHAAPPARVSARARFPWQLSKMLSGETVAFSSADDIPSDVDREGLRSLGTRSGVTVPLVVRGKTWGALTFATINEGRTWTPELITRLRVLALMFANALARKESDEHLQRAMAGQERQRTRLRDENAYLRHELATFIGAPAIVGHSAGARRMLEQVRQAAATDAAVLLHGETGTGKSLLAHRIHELSANRDRAMVRFNCASLSAATVEAELFGREKGAYLGGESRQVGLLELGRGSTVFFDEIADLSPDLQASLARVLQTRQMLPLGSARPITVDFRVIAATRHDLTAAMAAGTFRDDLYYRLNVLPITVPPLRDRIEDIPQLVWRFVDEFSAAYGKSIETIDQASLEQLQQYDWPGNARELRNVVERAMIVATGRRLRIALPATRRTKRRRRQG